MDRLSGSPTAFRVGGRATRLIVESESPIVGLDATAAYRFQIEGADVLSLGGEGTSFADACLDALQLAPAPRTLSAMRAFIEERGTDDG